MKPADANPDSLADSHRASQASPAFTPRGWTRRDWVWLAVLLSVVAIGSSAVAGRTWFSGSAVADPGNSPNTNDAHAGHDHDQDHPADAHPEHDSTATLELSVQAQKNIGLTLADVQPRDFQRTVTVPAVVVERPGRSELTVSAPMTGIVQRIYPLRGEAVAAGDPVFELRLTHEDMVEKQSSLLRDLEQLDVIQQEITRLENPALSGVIAAKTILERVYEKQKIEAAIRASQQALLLHGLSESQIDSIGSQRRLIRQLTITTPEPEASHAADKHEDFLQVADLNVRRGDHVQTGTPLAMLTDHCELYIEGQAFSRDAEALNQAASEHSAVTALIEAAGEKKQEVSGLQILFIESQVARDSRALKFYVGLPNELLRNDTTEDGHRFIAWRFKPGQRVEVLVPVEVWKSRVVLPVQSVIQEGPESFVFEKHGNHFDRRAVHVEYRDQRWVVIENDGMLGAGDKVAVQGAYQIHLAIKNQAGGGIDPHAGHQH